MQPHPNYPSPKRKPSRRWFLLIAALALSGWAIATLSGDKAPTSKVNPPVQVRTAPVTRSALPITVEAVGTVVPYETVAVRSRIDSQMVKVHFHDGQAVKAGDLLFTLDDAALKAEAAQLRANIARDRAQLENARRQSGRAVALAEKGFATNAVRDDSRAGAEVAAAALNASLAALESVETRLAFTRITAPISGRTGTINVTQGNTIKMNDATPLVAIHQVKPIRVQASLPQALFAQARAAIKAGGEIATAYPQSGNDTTAIASGTLEYLDNEVNTTTGTVLTRARFDNPNEQLWPGMFVTLRVQLGEEGDALSIPETAIQRGQQGEFVFVIEEGIAHPRAVTTTRVQAGRAVLAPGSVTEGEHIAIDGLLALKDGAAVAESAAPTPTPESPDAKPAPDSQ